MQGQYFYQKKIISAPLGIFSHVTRRSQASQALWVALVTYRYLHPVRTCTRTAFGCAAYFFRFTMIMHIYFPTMASPTDDDRPPSGGRPTLWAASRGLGMFFLLRFFATHATIAYLAYSQLAPAGGSGNSSGNATATSSRDGISTIIGTSLSEAASQIDKLKSMINRNDQKSRQRPEPIIKTVTKTVTKKCTHLLMSKVLLRTHAAP